MYLLGDGPPTLGDAILRAFWTRFAKNQRSASSSPGPSGLPQKVMQSCHIFRPFTYRPCCNSCSTGFYLAQDPIRSSAEQATVCCSLPPAPMNDDLFNATSALIEHQSSSMPAVSALTICVVGPYCYAYSLPERINMTPDRPD
jgi:hypothetical protein